MIPLPELEAAITAGLSSTRFGRPLRVYERLPSTNDVARDLAAAGAGEGTAVLALEQTAGRGRLGRAWRSPRGGLYLSVVLRPALPLERWTLLGCAAALAAAEAGEEATGRRVTLKWPNDLLADGLKVGGILVEVAALSAVAGIGLNLSTPIHELPRAGGAGSLGAGTAALVPMARLVLLRFERAYDLLHRDQTAVLDACRARSATLGRRIRVVPQPRRSGVEEIEGVAEDIDRDGALLVRTPLGTRRVVAGDVSLRDAGEGVR